MERRRVSGSARVEGPCAIALALVLCTGPPTGCDKGPEESAGPQSNVVLFAIDTLRADRLESYGYGRSTSPNVEALARVSTLFENVSAAAPWTLPSVASLLTSKLPCDHGVLVDGDLLPDDVSTLAEGLARAGYATANLYSNPLAGPVGRLDRGFETAEQLPFVDGKRVGRWLDEIGGAPFFLYIHNSEPHDPYTATREATDRYMPVEPEQQAAINRLMSRLRRLGRVDFSAGRPVGETDNSVEQKEVMEALATASDALAALYDGEILAADQLLGDVVNALLERGLWRETLFVLVSDHGDEFGEHGGWQHDHSVYEELLRVPLLIHFPRGRFRGRRVRAPVSLLDVVPTVADVLGRPELAEGAEGTSLLPVLTGRAGARGEVVMAMRVNRKKYFRPYAESRGDVNVVVRDGRWKAIWNAEPDTLELYDLERDEDELNDLSNEEPVRAAALRAVAERRYARCIRPRGAAERGAPPDLDPAARERLRALGYAD